MASGKLVITDGVAPSAPGAGLTAIYATSGTPRFRAGASGSDLALVGGLAGTFATPADPGGTTSTTLVMMGLAATLTPVFSGNALIIITGTMRNGTGNTANGGKAQISYGTGSAPANAAALTGTQAGNIAQYLCWSATNNIDIPFTCIARVTGLSAGTAYWIDLAAAAITAGTLTPKNLAVLAQEV